jgi:hypothetical protein
MVNVTAEQSLPLTTGLMIDGSKNRRRVAGIALDRFLFSLIEGKALRRLA